MNELEYSKPIPITRTLEHKGKKYVYGYACIFDSPDHYGTLMTKQVVETSLQHLKLYPALRLLHRIPFGQLIFDTEIEGIKTFIDSHGFHVLAEIYDNFKDEWQMIRKGGWGFSYGFMPARKGSSKTVCVSPSECYEGFVKGLLYEISVVDTPAHSEAQVHTIERALANKTQQIICTEACEFHFACANFNPNNLCAGFQLKPNEELKRYMKQPIDNYDRASLKNYITMIHATKSLEIKRELSQVVRRFLQPERKLYTMRNFETYEIVENKNGSHSLKLVQPKPKPKSPKLPYSQEELTFLSRNKNRIKRGEKEG